ncbi:hypothetical protein DPMN_189792 [Dreissena polymorpha]|uniref:Uncharacterized protein n=1 Tax=Dreissena polymorpha TaxID=45954 RepID=A0A9D4DW60_DREPO|nr:hypothetical protein DPMN_189792 [Dreissena polymorpha]
MFGQVGEAQWRTVGGGGKISNETFERIYFEWYQAVDADEKFNVRFNKIDAVEQIQVKASEAESVVKHLSIRIDEQDDKINALTYTIIDLETRNRNITLWVYGYRQVKIDVYDGLTISYTIENAERLGRLNNQRGRSSD